MLFEFLTQHKEAILQLCRDKVLAASESKPTSALLDRGLPAFLDELIGTLQRNASFATDFTDTFSERKNRDHNAAELGKESLRLGYTISQVVHAYGAVCQSITEFVQTQSYKITAQEFQDLNFSLDSAIAQAVTEFEKIQSENANRNEVERLGFLVHELGNSLAAASIAYRMIQKGQVGNAGVTSEVLSNALERMRRLIGSSLAEVRMHGKIPVERTPTRLIDIVSEVEAAAMVLGRSKEAHLECDVDPAIQLIVDPHLIFSALSNLVSNAMKFTIQNGKVSVRSKESEGRVLIEVEDECGGLSEEETEELFKPFAQKGADRTGMGLGLPLSRRAVELNQGTLTARNIPGKGCVFTIDLPKAEEKVQAAA